VSLHMAGQLLKIATVVIGQKGKVNVQRAVVRHHSGTLPGPGAMNRGSLRDLGCDRRMPGRY